MSVLISCALLGACHSRSSVEDATPAATAASREGEERCRTLGASQLGSATIERAEPVERGTPLLGVFKRVMFRIMVGADAMPDLTAPQDFCRVTAKLRPVTGSEITAEVWLPRQWNNKVLAVGGGGFSGGLGAASLLLLSPVKKGYVAMATDAGHKDTDSAQFAHEFPEQYIDYAYRANHVAAAFAKTLAASYYSSPVERAYFQGCSNGGRDALMEARRFPEDYDGIIAGAPAANWSGLATSFAWNAQAVQDVPKLKDKLKLVQNAVIAKCDALDGVKDQVLENPTACSFDSAALQCRSGEGADCLTANEVSALRNIYAGPSLSDGENVYAGMPVGGEGLEKNWDSWIAKKESTQAMFARETFRWMVYGDPSWELDRFDIDRDYPKAKERLASIMNSDDPDLAGFVKRGGKLLLYHGWSDAAIPAGATLTYYASLRQTLGPISDEHVRLFMIPGMMHCGGGAGMTDFDLLDQLDRWVEGGAAPERIVATQYDPPALLGPGQGAKAIRTRPLCPWPKVARYAGNGSMDDAANFRCE